MKTSTFFSLLLAVSSLATCTLKSNEPVNDAVDNSPKIPGATKPDIPEDSLVASAFESINCPPVPPRNFDASSYSGKLIDTHVHIAPLPDGEVDDDEEMPIMGFNVSVEDYVCMLEYEGTDKAFGFFSVWEPIAPQMLQMTQKTMEKYPDKFVPFIMPPDHDDSPDGFPTVDADTLKTMLAPYPGLFKGYGEIGLYARGDHGGPAGAPALPPDSKRLLDIYPVVRENNLLVYFHLGEGQQASLENAAAANPDINFIFHGDQLIPPRQGDEPEDLSRISAILENHSNVFYGVDELYGDVWLIRPEVTKEEFLAHFQNLEPLLTRDVATWKAFIEAHPDQVLWGTDRGWSSPWSLDPEVALTLNDYSRVFIGRLAPAVQEKFAYQNAEKLLAQ